RHAVNPSLEARGRHPWRPTVSERRTPSSALQRRRGRSGAVPGSGWLLRGFRGDAGGPTALGRRSPRFRGSAPLSVLVAGLMAGVVSGCGQKGPLVLPDAQLPGQGQATAPATNGDGRSNADTDADGREEPEQDAEQDGDGG